MIQNIEKRQDKRFEIQWYDEHGNSDHITRCDTLEELAQVLCRTMWGSISLQNNPTIYYNGFPFCSHEYTEITPDMYGNGK